MVTPAELTGEITGALAGFVASLVPGLHVNTLAAFTQAFPPAEPAITSLALIAAFAASLFAVPVVGAFLGAPTEESAASVLPAHRLLREGRGHEAAALAAFGSFLGIAGAFILSLPATRLLAAPHDGARVLEALLPFLLPAIALALIASERSFIPYVNAFHVFPGYRRGESVEGTLALCDGDRLRLSTGEVLLDESGALDSFEPGDRVVAHGAWTRVHGPLSPWIGRGLALAVLLIAGAFGGLAFKLGSASPLGWPSSPLLPALAGLFGAPALLLQLANGPPEPSPQLVSEPRVRWKSTLPRAGAGIVAGAAIGLLPGLSPAVAGTLALAGSRNGEPEETLLVLGATAGAGGGFSLVAWLAMDRARSGALAAAGALAPKPEPVAAWFALLLGATAGYALALAAARGFARAHGCIPERALAAGALGLLVAATWAFTGGLGLLELATGCAIGLLPHVWGVRRAHCMGVILVPVILYAWGL